MTVIIEGGGFFAEPVSRIEACEPAEVAAALAAMQDWLAKGYHLAGYFSYELGYALEPKLLPLMPADRRVPLLWFGVYPGPRPTPDHSGRAYAGPISWEWDEAAYAERFAKVAAYIRAGDIYQANLSMRGRFPVVGDPLGLYYTIGSQRHGAYLDDGERQILSFSPELFFDLDRHGHIVTKPMKGTAKRGADQVSDHAARAALAASAKDRAENLMIVDLLRNDLSRIGDRVKVADLFAIESYPTLHQMVSTVTAHLRKDSGIEAIVRGIFPSGSITGAPKIRAMEIIRELEVSPRGVYCGSIGHFAPDGSARFNVAIRTLTIAEGSGELGVGGAVVADSQCAAEYAECLLKARYFEAARRPIELI
jgi:aminodeoxychorismate synthase component I